METRKLVKTGADTYTVSIPKNWIISNNLKKGDILYLYGNANTLSICPVTERSDKIKEITIQIDDKDIGTIRRETIAAYMNNNHVFTFVGKTLNKKVSELHQILDNFLALEIQEQTDTKIVAKDFLNLQEFSLKNTIRRMDMLTRGMLSDAKISSNAESLEFRDFEVDKNLFLISRIVRGSFISKSGGMDDFNYWNMAKNIERISEAAKSVCALMDKKSLPFYEKLENYYKDAITAFFKEDKKAADQLIAQKLKLTDENDAMKSDIKIFFKEIIVNTRNIAKIVLDS